MLDAIIMVRDINAVIIMRNIIVEGIVAIELFLTFFKIGLFTFGGGYAMISLIQNACVEKKKWITHDEMMDITVIAESTPGPIAINCATFVGYKQGKLIGAIAATLGVTLPSFVIIYIISRYLDGFLEIGWIADAFHGIKLAVGILIIDAAVKMIKKLDKKFLSISVLICAFGVMILINANNLNISSMFLMLLSAFVGILVLFVKMITKKGGNSE
jgi:chromate transporter